MIDQNEASGLFISKEDETMAKKNWYKQLSKSKKKKIDEMLWYALDSFISEAGREPYASFELDEVVDRTYHYLPFQIKYTQLKSLLYERIPNYVITRRKQINWMKKMERHKRHHHAKPRQKPRNQEFEDLMDQDDYFYMIIGETSDGAPFGITWEEYDAHPEDYE